MASLPRRIYWDACSWIALIQKEKIQNNGRLEDREMLCRSVIIAAKRGDVEIATSTLSYAEVCKDTDLKKKGEDKIAEFFENDYILPVTLDRNVGEKARWLMLQGHSGLKPADAVHIASAVIANVEAMHTFDKALLKLDGTIDMPDGSKLKIIKPDAGSSPAPLFERRLDIDETDDRAPAE